MTNRRSKAKTTFGYGIFPETDGPAQEENEAEIDSQDDSAENGRGSSELRQPYGARSHYGSPKGRPMRNNPVDTRFGPVGKKGEPLCLAEILAIERSRGFVEPDYDETYEKLRRNGDATYLSDLDAMSIADLVIEARNLCVEDASEQSSRQELIFQILKKRIRENGLMFGEGTLEILPDQFGFLRSPEYHYRSSPDDIYISPSQIRRFGLRKGCTVTGQIRPPKENERYFALLRVEAINHEEPNMLHTRPVFDQMTPVYPNRQIMLSRPDGPPELNMIDLMTPLGFGQRGLIVCPPNSDKTTLMRKIASAALKNHPDLYVFMLLLEGQPEEINEMVREMGGDRCEVVGSLFDEPPGAHIHVADIVLEKAKRMVEYGKDVIVFLDSMTRLTHAWNAEPTQEGGESDGTREAVNMQASKKYFASARKLEEGGSLTLFAAVSIQTNNPADDAIYDAFKGRGNLEIRLDRDLAEKRIWPPIDFRRSMTQHEEFLLTEEEFQRAADLRRRTATMTPEEIIELLGEIQFRSP